MNHIVYPSDLKQLPVEALPQVCDEVRDFIIRACSQNPGHLGSSLGTVELTVALHYVYNTPNDRLVWDVGHQAYAHKILTGRRERFHTNRQFKGISPFPKPDESEYDAFIAGHASNSISAALGEAIAADKVAALTGEQAKRVVAIIGDGAMTGGLAFEGLNNTAMQPNNLLIILNDNNMAIDPIRGGFTQYLVDLTTSSGYNWLRWNLYRVARKLHLINDSKKQQLQRFTNNLKTTLTRQPKNIFSSMNLRYFGPADGHNVLDLVRILSEIKDYKGARVLHIVTQKGKGYAPAEENPTIWHAPGEFNVETGMRKVQAPHPPKGSAPTQELTHSLSDIPPLWQEVFGETLLELARENERIVGITPAMPSGCSMNIMQAEMPERVFDVGIAEGHAVTFSAGLASEGLLPYCNIYSSFLQRAYDNIIHDVAIPQLPVVLCIDRAGIVGNDGATHHGLLDLAFLRPVPNMIIGAPMTADDLRQMLYTAQFVDGPIAIRYPRGRVNAYCREDFAKMEIGRGVCLKRSQESGVKNQDNGIIHKVAVLSLGAIGETVREAVQDLNVAHYDMRWLKPLDTSILDDVVTNFDTIVTVEDGVIAGGLGGAVAEYLSRNQESGTKNQDATQKTKPLLYTLGIDDQFVEHGSTKELYQMLGLDKEGIYNKIKTLCE